MNSRPMETDPIDGGPKEIIKPNHLLLPTSVSSSSSLSGTGDGGFPPTQISAEEGAKHAIDMFRGDDLSARVAAANQLESIASVLGEKRTREELLPFITDGVDDEDEVLLVLATALGKMVNHVGGVDYAQTLIPPIELLLMVEEKTVRDAAAVSAVTIGEALPDQIFQNKYSSMIARLARKEWFTARISSCGLMSNAYPRLTKSQQDEFLKLFTDLCQDDTPMVRRVAAQNLGCMVKNTVDSVGRSCLQPDGCATKFLIPLYEKLSSNDQPDSVRLQTTENCVVFGRVMGRLKSSDDSDLNDHEMVLVQRILALIVAMIDDRSWRVRWTAAAKFADVIKAYNPIPGGMKALIPAYEKLLQDPEAEVRTAASFNLAVVAQGCEAKILFQESTSSTSNTANGQDETMSDVDCTGERVSVSPAERLVKRITLLTEDSSEHVRAALAMVATDLAPILGKDATIKHLVPPILLLLRDVASEVRLNLISSLESLNKVVGVDLLSQSLLPAILDLAQDGKWRIRMAIIQQTPLLAKQLGKDFFTDKLSSICVNWLADDIATIRDAATKNIRELTGLFGTEWACEYLLPYIDEISQDSSYLRRLTAVQACAKMSTEMDPTFAQTEVLPLVLEMATDTVANIRFNVAKALGDIGTRCEPNVYNEQIHPVLMLLHDDPDRDVRFHANKTVIKLGNIFAQGR